MDVEIRTLEAQHTAVIRRTVKPEELGAAFMECVPKVHDYAHEAVGGEAGPPFGRYFDYAQESIDVEIGIPVGAPVTASGDVTPSEIPGGRHAVTVHVGPYDKLPQTYDALFKWVAENGHEVGGPPFESYIEDPGSTPMEKVRTEVLIPLK